MAFDYNSRTKWEKARLEHWNKEHEKQIKKLSPEKKELFDEVRCFSNYMYCGFPVIRKWTREHLGKGGGKAGAAGAGKTLKELMLSECGDLIGIFVPEQYRADYEYLLDQYAEYQYSRALFRPTVRTKDPEAHTLDAFGLMQAFKVLGIYGVTPFEYLQDIRVHSHMKDLLVSWSVWLLSQSVVSLLAEPGVYQLKLVFKVRHLFKTKRMKEHLMKRHLSVSMNLAGLVTLRMLILILKCLTVAEF